MITTDNWNGLCYAHFCQLYRIVQHIMIDPTCFLFEVSLFFSVYSVQLNQISLVQFRMCLKQQHAISVHFTHKNKHQLWRFHLKEERKNTTNKQNQYNTYWLEMFLHIYDSFRIFIAKFVTKNEKKAVTFTSSNRQTIQFSLFFNTPLKKNIAECYFTDFRCQLYSKNVVSFYAISMTWSLVVNQHNLKILQKFEWILVFFDAFCVLRKCNQTKTKQL